MYCKNCKYPLLVAKPDRCPECGRPFDPARGHSYLTSRDQWCDRQQRLAAIGLVVGLAIVIAVILALLTKLFLHFDAALRH